MITIKTQKRLNNLIKFPWDVSTFSMLVNYFNAALKHIKHSLTLHFEFGNFVYMYINTELW